MSESGYYAWAARPGSATEQWRQELVGAIEEIHAEVKGRYGSPRMTAELNARGYECSEHTVAELMRGHGFVRRCRGGSPVRPARITGCRWPRTSSTGSSIPKGRTSAGIVCTMSGVGQCRDNAPMGSFLGRMKCEIESAQMFATRDQARAELFEYLEVFHNRVRRHSSLGFLSPVEYERAHNQTHR